MSSAVRPPGYPASPIQGPVWPLSAEVFRLARIGRPRACDHVKAALCVGTPQAEEYIRQCLCTLTPELYVKTYKLFGKIADVYGLKNNEGDWYVKFHQE